MKVNLKLTKPNRDKNEQKKRSFLSNIKIGIGAKIMILVLAMAAASVCSMLILSSSLKSIVNTTNDIFVHQVAEQEAITNLSKQFTYINSEVMGHVMTTNAASMDKMAAKIETDMAVMDQSMTDFEQGLSADDPRRADLDAAKGEYEKYKKTVSSLLETSKSNKQQASVSATSNLPMFNENIEGYMTKMLTYTSEKMEAGQKQVASNVAGIPVIVAGAVLIIIVVAILTLVLIRIWISRPIIKSTGQVDTLVKGIKNNQGDLTLRVNVSSQDEIGRLAQAINDLVSQMQSIITETMAGCNELAGAQKKIAMNVEHVNDSAVNNSSNIQQVNGEIEQILASVSEVKDDTILVEEAVEKLLSDAESGSQFAAENKSKAHQTEESAVSSKKQAVDLVHDMDVAVTTSIDKSAQIHEITNLTGEILGIAGTTNLLALNASIEAARAGEAGKGFAVVADEIRVLADRSRETANNIQEISAQVVESVEELAANTKSLLLFVTGHVLKDYEAFEDAGRDYFKAAETMDGIMSSVKDSMNALMQNVNNVISSNNMIEGAVTNSAEKVEGVTVNNCSMEKEMEGITSQMKEMNQVIMRLQGSVECFKKY